MAMSLTQTMGRLTLAGPPCNARHAAASRLTFTSSLRGTPMLTVSRQTRTVARGMFQPVEAKQNSLKRQKTAEKARVYNKSHKSAIATRIKKVFSAIAATKASPPGSEAELAPVEKLISEAFQEIDKAVSKGILHQNTGARRKSRLSVAKRDLLVTAGFYTPASS